MEAYFSPIGDFVWYISYVSTEEHSATLKSLSFSSDDGAAGSWTRDYQVVIPAIAACVPRPHNLATTLTMVIPYVR